MNIREAKSLDKYVQEIEELLIAVESISPEKYQEYKTRMREFYRSSGEQTQERNVKTLFDMEMELMQYIKEDGYDLLSEKQRKLMIDLLNTLETNVEVSNVEISERNLANMELKYKQILNSAGTTFSMEQIKSIKTEINEARYKIIKHKFMKHIKVELNKEISEEDAPYVYKALQKDIENMRLEPSNNMSLEYIKQLIDFYMNTDINMNDISNKIYDKTIWQLVSIYEEIKMGMERVENIDKRIADILQHSRTETHDAKKEEQTEVKKRRFWKNLFGKRKKAPLLLESQAEEQPQIQGNSMTDLDYFRNRMQGFLRQSPITNQVLEIPPRITEEEAVKITDQGISSIYVARYNTYIQNLKDYKNKEYEPEGEEVQHSRQILDHIKLRSSFIRAWDNYSFGQENGQHYIKSNIYEPVDKAYLPEEQIEIIKSILPVDFGVIVDLMNPSKVMELREIYSKSRELLNIYNTIITENYKAFPENRTDSRLNEWRVYKDARKRHRKVARRIKKLESELEDSAEKDGIESIHYRFNRLIGSANTTTDRLIDYHDVKGKLSTVGQYFETLDEKQRCEQTIADYEEGKANFEREKELRLQEEYKKAMQLRNMITGYRKDKNDNQQSDPETNKEEKKPEVPTDVNPNDEIGV